MIVHLPYGPSHISAEVPDDCDLQFIMPREIAPATEPDAVVRAAVYNPLGDVKPPRAGQTVAIAINDKTRPVPHEHLLPPVLQGMRHAGVRDEDVLFIIATGTHPAMPPGEYSKILTAEICETYRVICHDASDEANLVALGETGRGAPIHINLAYMEADYRIAIGNIEPHQFQGYSGGVKSAAIGLAGRATINQNHAMMQLPGAKWGEYTGNPARQDVEEIGARIGIDFCVNAVLTPNKQIVAVFAGDPAAVMRAGIPVARELYEVQVAAPYDLMIASPGGHPKDINIYQAQKGLAHAASVTRDGGELVLCAACPEGSGNADYERWMLAGAFGSHDAVLQAFAAEGFRVGRHKAFQVSRDAARVKLALISELEDEFARALLLNPQRDLQEAIDRALEKLPAGARVAVMPYANATMPVVVGSG